MCNLYAQTKAREVLARVFGVSHNRTAAFEPQPAIFPGQNAPVVRLAADGEREIAVLSWGFVLPQKDKAAKRVTNARADKVRCSSFWKGSFEERRCLVPVTSFAEPKGRRPVVWHWFGLKDAGDRPVFAFAGFWRPWKGHLKPDADPVEMDVYAFLTTTPNYIVRRVHPHRMPVMLSGQEQFSTWLEGSTEEAIALIRPFPANQMQVVLKGEKQDPA